MAKKLEKPGKCSQCNLEFPDTPLSEEHKHKAFVWKGKVMCEDCLFKMGVDPAQAQTWATFVSGEQSQKPRDY